MGIDIRQLGPDAQRQVREKLARQDTEKRNHAVALSLDEFDSNLERDYYLAEILPLIQRGLIERVELHRSFELFAPDKFCGIRLSKIEYTPDFVVTYADGRATEVVEVKHRKIKQLQRDYALRRRIFIEQYARPCGWAFKEVISG